MLKNLAEILTRRLNGWQIVTQRNVLINTIKSNNHNTFILFTTSFGDKGIYNRIRGKLYKNGQTIKIPVIENVPDDHLIENVDKVFKDYPNSCSVLVKEHGLFVFCRTWQQAKRE